MQWINVVDLNISNHLPPCIHHGIEFFRTSFLEIPWRLLDHGYVRAQDRILWYVVPRGTSVGIFYLVAPESTKQPEIEATARDGMRHLLGDDESEWGTFLPSITGCISIDQFIGRVLDQPAWLIYNALHETIPGYMTIHSITAESISNRKHRIIRTRAAMNS
jgi:hypothetical protein